MEDFKDISYAAAILVLSFMTLYRKEVPSVLSDVAMDVEVASIPGIGYGTSLAEVELLALLSEGIAGIDSGTLEPVEYLPLRPDDLLETRFHLSMSLSRKGAALLWLLDELLVVVEL